MSILENIRKEKVEWKRLGDVCEVGTGKSNAKEQNENGIYPFYVRSKDIKKSLTFQFDETAIIIPGEGGIGEIFHYVEGKYALHQRAYRIHVINSNLNTKYLYYYMSTLFKKYIIKNSVLSTVSSIRKPTIENFKIPIPSIETQTKIVEILDKFTEYIAVLNEELTLRVKQYEYYRDMLLSEEFLAKKTRELCGQGVLLERKTLGNIFEIGIGGDLPKNVSKEKTADNFIPILSNGKEQKSIYGWTDKYRYNTKCITISARGTIGWTNFVDYPFYPIVRLIVLSPKIEINCKFAYYYLKLFENSYNISKAGIAQLTKPMIINKEIVLPPLKVQEYIVDILDKFDTLANDLKEGLPREIELRGKQYEYYREKLLDFK